MFTVVADEFDRLGDSGGGELDHSPLINHRHLPGGPEFLAVGGMTVWAWTRW